MEMVKSLGADKVIDYTKEEFSQSTDTYDIIFDAVGKLPSSIRKKALKTKGVHLNVNNVSGKLKVDDIRLIKELCETEKLKPVIDRSYALEEIVEAHRYVDKGHKKGNVVITVG